MKARVERKARPSTSLPAIKRPGRAPGTWLLFLRYLRVVHELRSLLFYILRLYFIRSVPPSSTSSSSHSPSLSLPSLSFSFSFTLLRSFSYTLSYPWHEQVKPKRDKSIDILFARNDRSLSVRGIYYCTGSDGIPELLRLIHTVRPSLLPR